MGQFLFTMVLIGLLIVAGIAISKRIHAQSLLGKSPFQTCTTLAHPYTYARWHDG